MLVRVHDILISLPVVAADLTIIFKATKKVILEVRNVSKAYKVARNNKNCHCNQIEIIKLCNNL